MTPSTSVIVVCHDNLAHTVRCVESLRRHRDDGMELVLVDNASRDGTRSYLREIAAQPDVPARLVLRDGNDGWCEGINAGLEVAQGEYVAFLNNDTLVTPGWVAGLRACIDEAPGVVPWARRVGLAGPAGNAVGGPQRLVGAPAAFPDADALAAFARRNAEAARGRWETTHFLSGFCLMARGACLREIGGLDPRFSPGGFDDNDLVLRAQERGWESMIAWDVFVHHEGGATFRSVHPEMNMGLANRGRFLRKWRERRAGKTRLVAGYRVRDAAGTLAESLAATARFADAIVVLDDGSTDETPSICERHPAVVRYERQDLPFDERRDRNRVLEMAAECRPNWIVSVDADEVFELDRPRAERLMQLADPHVKALGFNWYTFWEPTRTYYRSDGVFGEMHGARMFRAEPGLRIVLGTERGLHCGNIPQFPAGAVRHTNVRVRHLGYDSEELRRTKLETYRRLDHSPRVELVGSRNYEHLVSSTVALRRYQERSGLSLCVITWNEEERLEGFLAMMEPFVDEICVVDSGSSDRTVEIARDFGAKLAILELGTLELDRLRNRCLELASQPWILCLDPDEEFAASDLPLLVRLMDDPEVHAYTFQVANHQKDGNAVMTQAVRLFRNDPRIRFSRPVHETVERSLSDPELVTRQSAIVLQHYGFLKQDADVERKIVRYYERNRQHRLEHPDDAMAWYNEALHLLNEGQEEEAVMFLVRAMQEDARFLSPRAQLAYVFQARAMRLWSSLLQSVDETHPVHGSAREAYDALVRVTPTRPYVGNARTRRGGS